MAYVDGFVLVVQKKNVAAYRRMAQKASKVWRKYGALEYRECVMDDAKPKGVIMTFPKMARVKPGETIVFAYIVYKSRAHRDSVNAKVMKDPIMNDPNWQDKPMPFDMKRLAFAGFKVIVDA